MDVLRGEELAHLVEHALQEVEGLFEAHAEHVFRNTPTGPDLIGAASAAEFGVGRQRCHHMAGQVDLGHNGDAALPRIIDDLTDLLLGVVAAVADAVVRIEVVFDHRPVAEAADFGETGVALNFEPPALVVREMPVETVELVERHYVEVLLRLFDAPEMSDRIHVHAAVGKARTVGNHAAGQFPFAAGLAFVDADREHLAEGLHRIEEAVVRACCDLHPLAGDLYAVVFFRQGAVFQEIDALELCRFGRRFQTCGDGDAAHLSGGRGDVVRKHDDGLDGALFEAGVVVESGAANVEAALGELDFPRLGSNLQSRSFGNGEHRRQEGDQKKYLFHYQ